MLERKKLADEVGILLGDNSQKQFYTNDVYWNEPESIREEYPIYILEKNVTKDIQPVKGMIQSTYCVVHQERNGRYDLDIEWLCDYNNKTTYLGYKKLSDEVGTLLADNAQKQFYTTDRYLYNEEIKDIPDLDVFNVLRIPIKYHDELRYQLFRVDEISKIMANNGVMRKSATAQHIFYDLKYKISGIHGLTGSNYTGWANAVFDNIMNAVLSKQEAPTEDRFSYSCDISGVDSTVCFSQEEQRNLVRLLLDGSESFIGKCGDKARLYRDNFRFSINYGTEGAEHYGRIVYGENMIDLDYSEDWSEVYTIVYISNNYNYKLPKMYRAADNQFTEKLPRVIEKRVHFEYPEGLQPDELEEQFERDAQDYVLRHSRPRINIKVSYHDIENNPLYADFEGLRGCEVGDYVTIINEKLGLEYRDLEIISKDYDVLEQKTISVEIGDFLADGVHENFYNGNLTEV